MLKILSSKFHFAGKFSCSFFLLAVLSSSGCVAKHSVPVNKFSSLEAGKCHKSEIVNSVGLPNDILHKTLDDGKKYEYWIYRSNSYNKYSVTHAAGAYQAGSTIVVPFTTFGVSQPETVCIGVLIDEQGIIIQKDIYCEESP